MAEPFLGEIRVFAFPFAPQGWALCNGALLPVQQNAALFSLLGAAYGGDGKTTFGLPDLQGRTPIDLGSVSGRPNYRLGDRGGSETVQLTAATMPAHSHLVQAVDQAAGAQPMPAPANNFPSTVHLPDHTVPQTGHALYGAPTNLVALNPGAVGAGGGNSGHNNMQQFSVVNFCIAISGLYPPRQ